MNKLFRIKKFKFSKKQILDQLFFANITSKVNNTITIQAAVELADYAQM